MSTVRDGVGVLVLHDATAMWPRSNTPIPAPRSEKCRALGLGFQGWGLGFKVQGLKNPLIHPIP